MSVKSCLVRYSWFGCFQPGDEPAKRRFAVVLIGRQHCQISSVFTARQLQNSQRVSYILFQGQFRDGAQSQTLKPALTAKEPSLSQEMSPRVAPTCYWSATKTTCVRGWVSEAHRDQRDRINTCETRACVSSKNGPIQRGKTKANRSCLGASVVLHSQEQHFQRDWKAETLDSDFTVWPQSGFLSSHVHRLNPPPLKTDASTSQERVPVFALVERRSYTTMVQ